MFGGGLDTNELYKHIKSIGYEFETHDLSKLIDLYYDENKEEHVLINTDIIPGELKIMLKYEEAIKLDDNYYKIIESSQSFNEFMDVPIKQQGKFENKYNVVMNIATDMAPTEFKDNLSSYCKRIPKNKNNLYTFKTKKTPTKKSKEYKIIFSDGLKSSSCGTFAGVEYIVTYLHPEKNNNIILETFSNACMLISEHLNNLTVIPGEFLIAKEKTKIGNQLKNLYYHEGTNLYYLPMSKFKDINKISILPQMTFRVDCEFLIPVMKQMVYNRSTNTKSKKDLHIDYVNIENVEKCVDELLGSFEGTPQQQNLINKNKQIKPFLFMIFYKIYMYLQYWVPYLTKLKKSNKSTSDGDTFYFKDYLTFASRHKTIEYFNGLKNILSKHKAFKGVDTFFAIIDLIYKPSILFKYLKITKKALKFDIVTIETPDFGNPNISFISFFTLLNSGTDWLIKNDIDIYTTRFDMPTDGTLLIEDRGFYVELQAFVHEETGIFLNKQPYLENFYKIGQSLIENNKIRNLNNRHWNAVTKRYNKNKPTKSISTKTKKIKQK
jgi:hypothetical protein